MKILDIAHRGASAVAPENTKSAFLEAIKAGANVIEFDIQATKDNRLVVIHDPFVNRTSNGTGFVHKLSFKQIRKLNFGIGKNKEQILTLEEALKVIGNKAHCIVEFKDSVKGLEEKALKIISKAKNKNKIWIHTPHKAIVRNIRKYDSNVRLGYVVIFSIFHRIMFPFYKRMKIKYNIDFFSIDDLFISKSIVANFIHELRGIGAKVYAWTANDLHTMNQCKKWRVDGIITNYPGILNKFLLREK